MMMRVQMIVILDEVEVVDEAVEVVE